VIPPKARRGSRVLAPPETAPPQPECRDFSFAQVFGLGLRCSRRCAAGSVSFCERARVGFSPAAPPVLLLPLAGFPSLGRSCFLLRIPASPSIDSGKSDGARLDFTAASGDYLLLEYSRCSVCKNSPRVFFSVSISRAQEGWGCSSVHDSSRGVDFPSQLAIVHRPVFFDRSCLREAVTARGGWTPPSLGAETSFFFVATPSSVCQQETHV
jgi:hypothetical protein